MANSEDTFRGLFLNNAGVSALISNRMHPIDSVPEGSALPRGHYEGREDHMNHLVGATGVVLTDFTVQWVADSHDGAIALAEAARQLSGYRTDPVQRCALVDQWPVVSAIDPGRSEGLHIVEQTWEFGMAETVPTN